MIHFFVSFLVPFHADDSRQMRAFSSVYLMSKLYQFCSVGFHTDSSWFFQMAVTRINTGFFQGTLYAGRHGGAEKNKKTY